jgi:hypothetical protein
VFVRLFHVAASIVLKKKIYGWKRVLECDHNITDNWDMTQSFASALNRWDHGTFLSHVL